MSEWSLPARPEHVDAVVDRLGLVCGMCVRHGRRLASGPTGDDLERARQHLCAKHDVPTHIGVAGAPLFRDAGGLLVDDPQDHACEECESEHVRLQDIFEADQTVAFDEEHSPEGPPAGMRQRLRRAGLHYAAQPPTRGRND